MGVRKPNRDFASDAELETIVEMWGKHPLTDIAAAIDRSPSIVEKWARHVLFLLPEGNRHSPLRKPQMMRCQHCELPQPLAKQCSRCRRPRLEVS